LHEEARPAYFYFTPSGGNVAPVLCLPVVSFHPCLGELHSAKTVSFFFRGCRWQKSVDKVGQDGDDGGMDNLIVRYRKLVPEAKAPQQAKPYDAGYDLFAVSSHDLKPGQRVLVSTGIAMAIPPGFEGHIRPRSGSALKSGIDVMGGTVDATYRGEVGVILINLSDNPDDVFPIRPGSKVAQIVIERCFGPQWIEVDELDETERGAGGFGHTGA